MPGYITRVSERLPLPPVAFVSADSRILEHLPMVHEAAAQGVADVLGQTASAPVVQRVGDKWDNGPYGSVEWFTDRAQVQVNRDGYVGEPQIFANQMHDDLDRDPTREAIPHIGYMLLSQDMTAQLSDGSITNFVFGLTRSSSYQSVQSIHRFLAHPGMNMRNLLRTTRHMARHETAHIIGLNNDYTIKNPDMREGIYEGHCMNDCTLQQVMTVQETIDLAAAREGQPHAGFCGDCTDYMRKR